MRGLLKKISLKHKNNKFLYYLNNFAQLAIPGKLFQRKLKNKLAAIRNYNADYITERVNYYNNCDEIYPLSINAIDLGNLRMERKGKVYFFDSFIYTRYFNPQLRANFLFGDITYEPPEPSIVKSRPIKHGNSKSVLLKLNKVRHFIFTKDDMEFNSKQNKLVGRGDITQPHRIRFFELFFTHPLCDIGNTNTNGINEQWVKERLTIDEQLNYKFILCLEGNDVASNLKWVMSSNSIAVMAKPKYETWFMEGTLIPDYHYILIKDDYSDLEDRLNYYIENTDKACEIIMNANKHVNQFQNSKQEDLISLMVLQKYFRITGQTEL